jgi:hypothetical protein
MADDFPHGESDGLDQRIMPPWGWCRLQGECPVHLRFFEAMLHKDAIARIIDPYGGPIGPKLRCSCPPRNDAQALQIVVVQFDGRHPHGS